MFSNNFFGLRGKKLNTMVVATAGMAFLLFGYGECVAVAVKVQRLTWVRTQDQGVMGSLLTVCPTPFVTASDFVLSSD